MCLPYQQSDYDALRTLCDAQQARIAELEQRCENAEDTAMRAEFGRNRLREALDVIPASLMLTAGPPYTLTFSEAALQQIDAALAASEDGINE